MYGYGYGHPASMEIIGNSGLAHTFGGEGQKGPGAVGPLQQQIKPGGVQMPSGTIGPRGIGVGGGGQLPPGILGGAGTGSMQPLGGGAQPMPFPGMPRPGGFPGMPFPGGGGWGSPWGSPWSSPWGMNPFLGMMRGYGGGMPGMGGGNPYAPTGGYGYGMGGQGGGMGGGGVTPWGGGASSPWSQQRMASAGPMGMPQGNNRYAF